MYAFNNRIERIRKHPMSNQMWVMDMKSHVFSTTSGFQTKDPMLKK